MNYELLLWVANLLDNCKKKFCNKPTCLHILALNTYYTMCYKDCSLHKAPQKPT
ncbi:hypothetical protein SAMN05216462_2961 [Xylanibacter ruminicola]|uniref:Uncharacterized protein n=1 Tax=Xylanibacter ruminicola TaxID=839 RepID=A0A1H4ETR6_XYLRU|nr:hypothetical protein SAMN05216462_2961 [Xylanibacter ruminicola]